ncbi:MAG: hypothetical protein JJT88_05425 [Gammaproteobacteria bacterium]|nr:hypothetical protein [Gammaproteobacteria bacterium]
MKRRNWLRPIRRRPSGFSDQEFQLRVQKIEDAEADFVTVMNCREHLRCWCHDTWPEDDFTLEQNREDLAGHIEDAAAGFAFGYTVWGENRASVLGSVYLYPAAYFAGRYKLSDEERALMASSEVLVDYWLIPALEARSEFHRAFVGSLQRWLQTEWGFGQTSWATRPGMQARRDLYESLGFGWGRRAEAENTAGWCQTFHLSP